MAYILKSNIAVSDPDNRFEYYTANGVAQKELALFSNALDATGYTLSAGEFNGLKVFIKNLKDALLWDKVYEVYPLIGKDLNGAAIKLKTLMGGSVMSPVDGFDNTMLEIVNGKVLGKKATAASNSNGAARLDTGVTVDKLLPSVGIHLYMGDAVVTAASQSQPAYGAISGASPAGNITQLGFDTFAIEADGALNSYRTKAAIPNGNAMSLLGFVAAPQSVGVSYKPTFYRNGLKEFEAAPVAFSVSANNSTTTTALFGRNMPLNKSTSGETIGYSGKVRFGCVTSGMLNSTQVKILHDEIGLLLIALGKTS